MRMVVPFHPCSHSSLDGFRISLAAHSSDDGFCGILGHNRDALHSIGADGRDGLLAFRRFRADFRICLGNRCIEIGLDRGARFVGDTVCLAAGIRQSFLICLFGIECFGLQLLSCGDIFHNGPLAVGQHRADARQGDTRQDEIDHDERDHEPENLVAPGREIELRHARCRGCAMCGVSGGSGGGVRFGRHSVLLGTFR
jgi:hypothetical protein